LKALIMSAGVGNRLEPLTLAIPKPLVPVCNTPVMQMNIELLKKNGIRDIAANLHYFPEQIRNYFDSGKTFGVSIKYSFEECLLGTAGGVLKMASSTGLTDDDFLVLSSDVVMDLDLKKLIAFHKKKKAAATIALVEVDDPSEYGAVITSGDERITAFQEKPKKEEALSRTINTGVYVLGKEILDIIKKNRFRDFGREVFPYMVREGLPLYGHKVDSYWKDIGTLQSYIQANFDTAGKKAVIGAGSKISRDAVLEGSVIIGENCIIRGGAVIRDSIIWRDTIVDADSVVDSSIIGSWCYLESSSRVDRGCTIANRCRVKSGSVVPTGTSMVPDQIM